MAIKCYNFVNTLKPKFDMEFTIISAVMMTQDNWDDEDDNDEKKDQAEKGVFNFK